MTKKHTHTHTHTHREREREREREKSRVFIIKMIHFTRKPSINDLTWQYEK